MAYYYIFVAIRIVFAAIFDDFESIKLTVYVMSSSKIIYISYYLKLFPSNV